MDKSKVYVAIELAMLNLWPLSHISEFRLLRMFWTNDRTVKIEVVLAEIRRRGIKL